jgi:D-ribose pyranose/furanose isomerase RbsD
MKDLSNPNGVLNVDSFLKEGTPEFYKTFELWSREIEINQKKKSLNRELADLATEMRKIDEEHRNLKYNSNIQLLSIFFNEALEKEHSQK